MNGMCDMFRTDTGGPCAADAVYTATVTLPSGNGATDLDLCCDCGLRAREHPQVQQLRSVSR